ncbi:hypothetical protein THAOC_32507, partial [Thalassiosira oceanica]
TAGGVNPNSVHLAPTEASPTMNSVLSCVLASVAFHASLAHGFASLIAITTQTTTSCHSRNTRGEVCERNSWRLALYRKFHDYAWEKLGYDESMRSLVPEGYESNASPARADSTVVASLRSIDEFPSLRAAPDVNNNKSVLRLARSAFLETQTVDNNTPLVNPMTIHVLNFVLFPSTSIVDGGSPQGFPIFGADVVSLPGNKHLVALDFQPILKVGESASPQTLLPKRYIAFEERLRDLHTKYEKSLPWGGDIPPAAQRFFSPYALWTRLADEDAMETVQSTVLDAFKDYIDVYHDLMKSVQADVDSGRLEFEDDRDNHVMEGQHDYLNYRRTNDPARPMLKRLYGDEWAEHVIQCILFPELPSQSNQ